MRVEVPAYALCELLMVGTKRFIKGLPDDAEAVGGMVDKDTGSFMLYIRHPDFAIVPKGYTVPMFTGLFVKRSPPHRSKIKKGV